MYGENGQNFNNNINYQIDNIVNLDRVHLIYHIIIWLMIMMMMIVQPIVYNSIYVGDIDLMFVVSKWKLFDHIQWPECIKCVSKLERENEREVKTISNRKWVLTNSLFFRSLILYQMNHKFTHKPNATCQQTKKKHQNYGSTYFD